MHAGFDAASAKANELGTSAADPSALAGKKLVDQIVTKNRLDDWYRTPQIFGPRMVVWLPERAWNELLPAQRKSIEAYVSSQYANWGIGVGRVSGKEVMMDRLVVEH